MPARLLPAPFHDFSFMLFGLHIFHFSTDPLLFTIVICIFLSFLPPAVVCKFDYFFFNCMVSFFSFCAPPSCCLHLLFLFSSSYIFPLLTFILRGTSFTLGDQPFLIDCQLLLLKLICILCSYCARQRTSDFE